MTQLDDAWKTASVGNLEQIAGLLLLELKDIDVHNINSYANYRQEIISILYKTSKISDEKIENVLREAVIKRGRADYLCTTVPKGCLGVLRVRADRLLMPEFLAYNIVNNIFSEEELKRIPLKRKDTVESFVAKYHKDNLLANLRSNLLNPQPEIKLPNMSYLGTIG